VHLPWGGGEAGRGAGGFSNIKIFKRLCPDRVFRWSSLELSFPTPPSVVDPDPILYFFDPWIWIRTAVVEKEKREDSRLIL
jgi:hypothetical protein